MINDYIDNINSIGTEVLFFLFKISIILITVLLIISLIMLITGCLIKSQKIKIRFLKSSIGNLLSLIFILIIPIIIFEIKQHI